MTNINSQGSTCLIYHVQHGHVISIHLRFPWIGIKIYVNFALELHSFKNYVGYHGNEYRCYKIRNYIFTASKTHFTFF